MGTVCSIMGYKLGRRMADVIAKDAQRPRKPRACRALDTTDCNAGRNGFLRVAVRDAGAEVGDVAPPLTDPEPTGSDPDMAARTEVLASATSAVATPVG